MHVLEQMRDTLQKQFPNAEFLFRKADDPKGFQFLNVRLDNLEVAIEWKAGHGFGVSSFDKKDNSSEGLFDAPDNHYDDQEEAYQKVVSLFKRPVS